MAWANSCGLVEGVAKGDVVYLEPKGIASRAQVATILYRFTKL